ncbi:MAG: F0F1 ATP synthase subunit delta [Candidatus Spechtbacterales bacterium]
MHYSARHYAHALAEAATGASATEQEGLARNLVALLRERGQLELLPAILGTVEELRAQEQAATTVRVVSAVPLSEKEQGLLKRELPAPSHKFTHNDSLIAGLVVQQGDNVYYGSVSSAIRALRDALTK